MTESSSLPSPTASLTSPFPLTSHSSSSTLPRLSSEVEAESKASPPTALPLSVEAPSLISPASSRRQSLTSSVAVALPPPYAEEKSYNPQTSSLYHKKSQELSLRLNSLTARRALSAGETKAIDDPDGLAHDLAQLHSDELETNVHFLPIDALTAQFHSNVTDGLSPTQVLVNRAEYGSNVVSPAGEVSYVLLFAQQLVSGFNALLWIATIVIFLSWQPLGSLNGLVPCRLSTSPWPPSCWS